MADAYNQADLIQLLGQATVELAYLRSQVVTLQARVAELEQVPSNGVTTFPASSRPVEVDNPA